MVKTYAQICLERAERASNGPWELYGEGLLRNSDDSNFDDGLRDALGNEIIGCSIPYEQSGINFQTDAEFIAHSRTDVVELARRLEKACDSMAILEGVLTRGMPIHPDYIKELREELERPLE